MDIKNQEKGIQVRKSNLVLMSASMYNLFYAKIKTFTQSRLDWIRVLNVFNLKVRRSKIEKSYLTLTQKGQKTLKPPKANFSSFSWWAIPSNTKYNPWAYRHF